ncbi:MAG: tRNA pseudouridine(38-40) synthase TruA [Tissierellia bacterium]|nr:tRNA pseudouridine(38-40) synthase TruA [Tissierellia bacterium]MDD4779918.1 tRNA pseudouridine(38-40) synthase TruA [Tissierellia bacterium]
MVRNIKLTIAYDGTKYHGWQTQPNKITIQGEIERAIGIITKQRADLIGSGRTDKGVHALGQVANFISDTNIKSDKIKIALNANLPKDIRIMQSEDVPMEFHSRFDAHKKTYMYQIYNDYISSPFYRDYSFFVPYVLNVDLMNEASKLLIGTHDFKGFMAAGSQVKTTVRTIYNFELVRKNQLIKLYITGNGFLYNMVRIIAGTLIDIGKGSKDISCISNAIETGDRTVLGYTANPEGLFLKEVIY